jgi:uncharacterized protein with NRDE domain
VCTLAIFYQVVPAYPVVIAANRDEYFVRPAIAPGLLCSSPSVVGGKDLVAGGTWLGLNEFGIVAGVLNRRSGGNTDPQRRSRGLLCLDVLRCNNVKEAAELLRAEEPERYNPFNLLVASCEAAFVASNRDGRIDLLMLEPGMHLLTNLNLDDFECPKISHAWQKFAALGQDQNFLNAPLDERPRLRALLSDHSLQLDSRSGQANAICVHRADYGTRSSSLIFLPVGSDAVHFYAPGPPCTTDYERVAAVVPCSGSGIRNRFA